MLNHRPIFKTLGLLVIAGLTTTAVLVADEGQRWDFINHKVEDYKQKASSLRVKLADLKNQKQSILQREVAKSYSANQSAEQERITALNIEINSQDSSLSNLIKKQDFLLSIASSVHNTEQLEALRKNLESKIEEKEKKLSLINAELADIEQSCKDCKMQALLPAHLKPEVDREIAASHSSRSKYRNAYQNKSALSDEIEGLKLKAEALYDVGGLIYSKSINDEAHRLSGGRPAEVGRF